jgi:hypothetical protein
MSRYPAFLLLRIAFNQLGIAFANALKDDLQARQKITQLQKGFPGKAALQLLPDKFDSVSRDYWKIRNLQFQLFAD